MEDLPIIAEHLLRGRKDVSQQAMAKLKDYAFPGNIRELENILESAVCVAAGTTSEADDIILPHEPSQDQLLEDVVLGNFWESVARPFAERLITRTHMEHLIRQGLQRTRGSYRKMLPLFQLPDSDYKRFMDFLRRHRCIVDFREYRKK